MENQTMNTDTATLMAEIERLKAQNVALKAQRDAKAARSLALKVSEKGALSVIGLGAWPVTLYREQWERLLAKSDDIRAFIGANNSALKFKAEK